MKAVIVIVVIVAAGIFIYTLAADLKKKRIAKRHPRLDQDGFAHITIQGKDYKFNPFEETPVEKRFPVDADRYIEDPVSVPVDFVLSLVGWDMADYYVSKATAAILRGGKFVVMPNADYVRAQEFLNSKKQ